MKVADILKLRNIPVSEIRYTSKWDYWDGILSGTLIYKERDYWFSCFSEAADEAGWIFAAEDSLEDISPSEQLGWWRRYAILEVSNEEIENLKYWHSLFEQYVGVHSSYDDKGNLVDVSDFPVYIYKGINCAKGMRDPNKYWGLYTKMRENSYMAPEKITLDNHKIIGWFER